MNKKAFTFRDVNGNTIPSGPVEEFSGNPGQIGVVSVHGRYGGVKYHYLSGNNTPNPSNEVWVARHSATHSRTDSGWTTEYKDAPGIGQPPRAPMTVSTTDPWQEMAGVPPIFVLQVIEGFVSGIAQKYNAPQTTGEERQQLKELDRKLKGMRNNLMAEFKKLQDGVYTDANGNKYQKSDVKSDASGTYVIDSNGMKVPVTSNYNKLYKQPINAEDFEGKRETPEEKQARELAELEKELAGGRDEDLETSPYDKKKAPGSGASGSGNAGGGTYVDSQGNRYPQVAVKSDQNGSYVVSEGRRINVSPEGESISTGFQKRTTTQIIGDTINLDLPEWSVLMDVPHPPATPYLRYEDFRAYATTTPVTDLAMTMFGHTDKKYSEQSFLQSLGYNRIRQNRTSGEWEVKAPNQNWKSARRAIPNYNSELAQYQSQYSLRLLNEFIGTFIRNAGAVINDWFREYRKTLDQSRIDAVWKETDIQLKAWMRVMSSIQARIVQALQIQ